MHYANLGFNIDKITIVGAAEQLFFTGFLFVRRNQLVPVRNFQFTSVLVVSVAQRINVPFVVGAVCLLNVGTNNIRFENCTFNAPVVTSKPNDFNWKKDALYFTGHTVFTHPLVEETTVMAPNFNIKLGNTTTADTIEGVTGLIVGGVVDVRGNVNIDGSLLSMYDPSDVTDLLHVTNVGFANDWEGDVPTISGTIRITPSPSRLLPMGVASKIILTRNGDQYLEL